MSCIHEDMLINVAQDTKSIDAITIGDMVSTWNYRTGMLELTEVLNFIILDSTVNYKVNNFIIAEDQALLDLAANTHAISPSATLTKYGFEPGQLMVHQAMFGMDGTYELITSIAAHPGTYRNYTILTKNGNFFADNKLVVSSTQWGKQ